MASLPCLFHSIAEDFGKRYFLRSVRFGYPCVEATIFAFVANDLRVSVFEVFKPKFIWIIGEAAHKPHRIVSLVRHNQDFAVIRLLYAHMLKDCDVAVFIAIGCISDEPARRVAGPDFAF